MSMVQDVVSLTRCLRCGSHAHAVTDHLVRCLRCGKASAIRDGILHLTSGIEDPAIDRERKATLALELGAPARPDEYSLGNLLAGPGPLRSAFLSLPYDDGSAYFRDSPYFRDVSKFAEEFDFIVDRLGLPPGGRILDVAADSTWSTGQLARRGWQPVAIDINHHLVASTVFSDVGVSFPAVNVDMHAPASQEAVFDGITAFSALHHTHRLDALIGNLAKMLRPRGRLGLMEPYWVNEDGRATFGIAQIEAGINENIYRLEEWHRALVNNGLEMVAAAAGDPFFAVYEKVAAPALVRCLGLAEAKDDFFKGYYKSRLVPLCSSPISSRPGAAVPLRVAVTNLSSMSWCSIGQVPVYLSYHLHACSDKKEHRTTVSWDNPRTGFSPALHAGQETILSFEIGAPSAPGHYALEFDLVQEGVTWYRDQGCDTAVVDLLVS